MTFKNYILLVLVIYFIGSVAVQLVSPLNALIQSDSYYCIILRILIVHNFLRVPNDNMAGKAKVIREIKGKFSPKRAW